MQIETRWLWNLKFGIEAETAGRGELTSAKEREKNIERALLASSLKVANL